MSSARNKHLGLVTMEACQKVKWPICVFAIMLSVSWKSAQPRKVLPSSDPFFSKMPLSIVYSRKGRTHKMSKTSHWQLPFFDAASSRLSTRASPNAKAVMHAIGSETQWFIIQSLKNWCVN